MSRWGAQSGEDAIAAGLFDVIGTTNRVAVDIGAMDGWHGSNTAAFRRAGWNVQAFDILPLSDLVQQVDVRAENVNDVLARAGVPELFDLLSIDIDGNDLWVWRAMHHRPRVVIVEYNPRWGARKSRVVPYDPERRWDKTQYYGASVLALCRLAEEKGYSLAAATRSNLIFVPRGLMPPLELSDVRWPKKLKRADPLKRKWLEYGA